MKDRRPDLDPDDRRRCDRECEVYSRVVGYHRPIKNWNRGKQQEFAERRPYKISTHRHPNNKRKKDHE